MTQKHLPRNFYFIIIAAIAALSGILFGYDTGVVSGAILFMSTEFQLSAQMNGVVVSAVLFGALMGALCSGRIADYWGRKRLLVIDALIFIAGTLATSYGNTIFLIILGRIIVGIAIGIASYVAPLYISEIAPAKHRGILVALNQLAITLGILLSYIADYVFALHGQWRLMFAVGVVPAVGFFIGLLFLPDSPRWIALAGNPSLALQILMRIHKNQTIAENELAAIQVSSMTKQRENWRELFSPFIRSTVVIGVGLAVLQQVTGINTIIYYAPTIFKIAGFQDAATAILATMGIGIVFVIFTLIGMPFIDRWGRRPLLLLGLSGMALSLFSLSLAFHHAGNSSFLKWIAMGSMLIYIACFAFSLGPIMWLMISEIYPLKIRGVGSSIATAANWGSNMIVALTFLSLIEWLGASGTFLLYCVISLLGLGFIYYLVPETRYVTLEQIETSLRTGATYRRLGQIS